MTNATIGTEHRDVRIVPPTEFQMEIVVPICIVCGHAICPGCQDWCDILIGEDMDLCCDGHCTPSPRQTTTIKASSHKQEHLDGWKENAARMVAVAQEGLCEESYSGRACGLPAGHTELHTFNRDVRWKDKL